ncbi:MAG: CHAD domain-containing protein [Betaproteobacteria bacterium]
MRPRPRMWRPPRLSRQDSPSALFAAVQAAALAQVAANRAGTLRSEDPEYLHQLRVGMRRLRSALRAFRDVAPRQKARRLACRTKGAMRGLGTARDWDVFMAWLERERPPRRLLDKARAARDGARASMQAAVARMKLAPVPAKRSGEPVGEFAASSLARLERKVQKQARRMDWDDAADRHTLRVRVKRLRYASEFFGRERPGLKRLQEVLGELNDVEVARRLLRRLSAREKNLYQALDRRERTLLRALEKMKTSCLGQRSGRRG